MEKGGWGEAMFIPNYRKYTLDAPRKVLVEESNCMVIVSSPQRRRLLRGLYVRLNL